jgi:uracil-DNA glycosylase
MDSQIDDELAGELADLTRKLRDQLLRHAALGAWSAPGGPTARDALAAVEPAEPGELDEPAGRTTGRTGDRPEARADERADDRAGRPPHDPLAPPEPRLEAMPGILVADAIPEPTDETPIALGHRTIVPARTLPQIRAELGECTRCKLHATRRTIVFGVGTADTPLMFVGEAPGEQEDRRGEPFVGPAGQLLDRMIEAMGWTRDAVYIANTTKCRPPGNRNPQPDELEQCMPFLHAQIAAIAPRIIVALGRPASNQLLGTDAPISSLRGRFHDYPRGSLERHSLKIMPTFHPAYLLRDPDKKRAAWSDLKLVMAELARLGISAPRPTPA